MTTPEERLASIPDYNNAVEYYLAGSSPTKIPSSARGLLRMQEYIIRPESSLSVDTIRALRELNPIHPSLFGPALGLCGLLAFSRSEIDHRGYALDLPRILGTYNLDQTLITPLMDPEAFKKQLTQFFLNSKNYPQQLKKLLEQKGGFRVV
jgi:hypothetical protein